MKTFKQFQQNIQEVDRGMGLAGVGTLINVGKQIFQKTSVPFTILRQLGLKGDTPIEKDSKKSTSKK